MPLIPKCMSTQHPDNAASPPYATEGVLKGEGEITEAATVFSLGCDEQMWDSEGKDVDLRVVQKLLSGYPDFFRHERHLGRDCALTLRLPNPSIESEMRKSLAEALHGIPAAWDVASKFYGDGLEPPIQEVILPFTTSAQELKLIDAYYRMLVVGQESKTLAGGETVKDWIGDFQPKEIRVIPLIEDLEHMVRCDVIVEEFLAGREAPFQRVFLARSDPAMNYGLVSAELMLKIGLHRLYRLEERLGVPLYPIVGVGAVPFRGHLDPTNVARTFIEYPSIHTATVQSAFKYDYDEATVQKGIGQILGHERSEPPPVDEERANAIMEKYTAEYQARVKRLAQLISKLADVVPKRRERRLHVGLFGYGRTLPGQEDATLPRAIGFCAALYSVGIPPELLGLTALSADELAFVRQAYPSMDQDLAVALRYTNEARVGELLGPEYLHLVETYGQEIDRVHEGLTSAIWASLELDGLANTSHYIEEAAHLRRFLG